MGGFRQGRAERALAWIVTGPVGHLAAGLIDWLELLIRWGWARAHGRELS